MFLRLPEIWSSIFCLPGLFCLGFVVVVVVFCCRWLLLLFVVLLFVVVVFVCLFVCLLGGCVFVLLGFCLCGWVGGFFCFFSGIGGSYSS